MLRVARKIPNASGCSTYTCRLHVGRLLQQVNVRCPAGCASDGCVLDSTSGGYKCHKCLNALVVDADTGTCKCPAGRYATTNNCIDCDKGYHCAGGIYTAPNVPTRVICDTDLTTIGKRSLSIKACGECLLWGVCSLLFSYANLRLTLSWSFAAATQHLSIFKCTAVW